MILILTSKDDATADYVVAALRKSDYLRLDSDDLPAAVKLHSDHRSSWIRVGRKTFSADDFSGVWYRRPKAISFPLSTDKAEQRHAASEYTAGLEGFLALIPEHRWINHPVRNVRAGHKLEQIRRAVRSGLAVPRTLITQDARSLRQFWRDCDGHVILKPLSSGYIEREPPEQDSLIYTNRVREEDVARSKEIARCPTLFQERVAKTADIRITVVDNNIQAVELTAKEADGEQRLDIRRNNMAGVKYDRAILPKGVATKILRLLRSYGLRFGAIDMLRTESSDYIFLEVNPNGQWAWLDMVGATNSRHYLIAALRSRKASVSSRATIA